MSGPDSKPADLVPGGVTYKKSLEQRVADLEAEVKRLKDRVGSNEMAAALSRGGGHGY